MLSVSAINLQIGGDMKNYNEELEKHREKLLKELKEIEEFRRGSINVVYRKCGKSRCACNQEDHPGHGPMVTLTYSEGGKTRTRSLSSAKAQETVKKQIKDHKRFEEWRKRWLKLNEEMADNRLGEVLSGGEDDELNRRKKKLRKPSSKRSRKKSKA
jgi:Family of unknown function (DUF6788)